MKTEAPIIKHTVTEFLKACGFKFDPGTQCVLPNGQVYYEKDGQPFWPVPKSNVEVRNDEPK